MPIVNCKVAFKQPLLQNEKFTLVKEAPIFFAFCTAKLCAACQCRNVHKLLIDTATSEYFFCREFFDDELVYKDLLVPIVQVVESDLAESLHVSVRHIHPLLKSRFVLTRDFLLEHRLYSLVHTEAAFEQPLEADA